MATISDIAKRTGFSICTVSKVLNGHPKTKQMRNETVTAILNMAKDLNYVPSLAAKALASGKTGLLGLVIGTLYDDVFGYFNSAFNDAARLQNRRVLTMVTDWNSQKELDGLSELRSRGCDGIFFMARSLSKNPVLCRELAETGYPVISYPEKLEPFSSVRVDYRTGFEGMVRNVAARKKKIVTLFSEYSERGTIMRELCEEYSISYQQHLCVSKPTQADILRYVELAASSRNSVFVFDSTTYALQALSGLLARGIKVPDEVELVGVGKERWAEYFFPALSTVTFDVESMMLQVVNWMVSYDKDRSPVDIVMPTFYTPRTSSII